MNKLPQPIADFFQAKNDQKDDDLLPLFSEDAVVVDAGEHKTMRGRDEIKQWIKKSLSGLNLHTEIKNYKEQNGEWIIDTIMKGNFPGSPARFEYFITLREHSISSLCVEFRGFLNK